MSEVAPREAIRRRTSGQLVPASGARIFGSDLLRTSSKGIAVDEAVIQHWLVSVARAAEFPGADGLDVSSDTEPSDAWSVAAMACGISEEELADRVARHFRLERANLSAADPTAPRLLPAGTARRLHVVPLRYTDRSLSVASADPVSLEAEREIGRLAGRSVHFQVSPPSELEEALEEAYPPEEEERHQVPALLSDDLDSPHVLVVDDDPDTRLLLRSVLRNNGFRVSEAKDGPQALEILGGSEAIHLVTLDLQMPEMHGIEVLRRIRSRLSTASIPVIVATGTDDPAVEMEALKIGADDFVVKPVDPPRFLLRVQAVLRRYGAGSLLGL